MVEEGVDGGLEVTVKGVGVDDGVEGALCFAAEGGEATVVVA